MEEGDEFAGGALPGLFVDQVKAGGTAAGEGGFKVIDFEREVMDALAPLLEELADRAVGRGWFEQLDAGFAGLEEDHADLLVGYHFRFGCRDAQGRLEGGDGFGEGADRDADMIELRFHPGILTEEVPRAARTMTHR